MPTAASDESLAPSSLSEMRLLSPRNWTRVTRVSCLLTRGESMTVSLVASKMDTVWRNSQYTNTNLSLADSNNVESKTSDTGLYTHRRRLMKCDAVRLPVCTSNGLMSGSMPLVADARTWPVGSKATAVIS